jgi:hypothetical protein
MRQPETRNGYELQSLCRHDSTVACDDDSIGINQDWIAKTEFLNRSGNLRNLLLRVSPAIASVWDEGFERQMLDLCGLNP